MISTLRNCKFAFKCNKEWDRLSKTNEKNVRFCSACQQEVYFCKTDAELVECIQLNRCVAILSHWITNTTTESLSGGREFTLGAISDEHDIPF
jgi:hypothetical protein